MNDKDQLIYSAIELAFTPASDIETPKLFCGRQTEIVRGLRALRSSGASLCVYGVRGVGKSSLSKQLMLVGAGLSDLTKIIKRPDLFDGDRFRMPNVYFCCDSSIKTTEDLFRKILSDRNSFTGIARYNGGAILKRVTTKTSASSSLTIKLLSAASGNEITTEAVLPELDYVAAFKSVTADIVDAADSASLILVIDDFELIADKVGIASVIKSTPHVKFILVGVADDYRALIADHESVGRQLGEGLIHVGLMDEPMLGDILARAEQIVAAYRQLRFTDSIKAKIALAARGYPYWVHRLGKECCYLAVEQGTTNIDEAAYDGALRRVVAADIVLEDRYREAVGSDEATEAVLRLLAYDKRAEHAIAELYPKFQTSAGLNQERVDAGLRRLERSSVLKTTREGFCSFEDPRFKCFAGFREPLFTKNAESQLTRVDTEFVWSTVASTWKYDRTIDLTAQDIVASYQAVYDISSLEGDPLLYDHAGNVLKRKSTLGTLSWPARWRKSERS